jgi:PAS domain S-box-containing protein/prepilin-type processing-associated H-X9-DG protein
LRVQRFRLSFVSLSQPVIPRSALYRATPLTNKTVTYIVYKWRAQGTKPLLPLGPLTLQAGFHGEFCSRCRFDSQAEKFHADRRNICSIGRDGRSGGLVPRYKQLEGSAASWRRPFDTRTNGPAHRAVLCSAGPGPSLRARRDEAGPSARAISELSSNFNFVDGHVGYLYSVVSFYRIASFTGMALHTAAALFLLSLGVFLAVPDRGLVAIFSSDSFGAIMLPRLVPAASLVPIVIGWFRMEGQKAGWYGTEFGLALMVTVNVMIFSVVIYLSAKEIDRIAIARPEAERALQTTQDGLLAMNYTFESVIDACPLPIVTLDRPSKMQVWNRAAEIFFGWSWLQVRGRPFFLAPDDRREEVESIIQILEQGEPVGGIQTVLLTSDDVRVSVTLWAAPIPLAHRGSLAQS